MNWDSWRDRGPTPPSIITNMINLGLAAGDLGDEEPLWGDAEGQYKLQYRFFMIAVICVPWMLIPKPIILIARMKPKEPEEEELDQGIEMIKHEKKEEEKVGLLEDYDKVVSKEDEIQL